jgi:hypothetical protein
MVAKAGFAASSTASARATDWRILFMTVFEYVGLQKGSSVTVITTSWAI